MQGLSPEIVSELFEYSRDEANSHGMVFRDKDSVGKTTIIPHTLLPTPFPKRFLDLGSRVQRLLNFLIYKMSQDPIFINKHLSGLASYDPFISSMLEIYNKSLCFGHEQVVQLAIIRSDYMEHCEADSKNSLKQVEFNTVSPSYGAQCCSVAEISRATLHVLGSVVPSGTERDFILKCRDNVVRGSPLSCFAEAILLAWKMYTDKHITNDQSDSDSNNAPCILIVVSAGEINSFDQLKLVGKLRNVIDAESLEPSPRIFMLHTDDLTRMLHYDDKSGILTLKINKKVSYEVGLVYFRTFYSAQDYSNIEMKNLRMDIELSRAIKVPSMGVQLVGCKRFQEVLSNDPTAIDHFTVDYRGTDVDEIKYKLTSTFASFYPLYFEEQVERAKKLVEENPKGYVLKPQREGGGHNIFGADIIRHLNRCSPAEIGTYTLMSMIKPSHHLNYLVSTTKVVNAVPTISELGVWGAYVFSHDGEELLNKAEGYLLRTKSALVLDGGVTQGRAALSAILCVDN